nr:DapH/DapD/GlmU-related protein [Nocardioides mangrovicus]
MRRAAAVVLYLAIGRHLPWSPRPGGRIARRFRAALATQMLDRCGTEVNIEHGAWFGSGRGIEVGDRSAIGMDALVIGPLTLGDDVMMGPRCMLIAANHRVDSTALPMNRQGFVADRRIVVEDDVWIGAGVTIVAGRRIGTGSIVAAGSVVTRDVAPWTVVGGNPAREIGRREKTHESIG